MRGCKMIRIIAGKHRSRMIKTPPSEIVLPTKNMVREALFSILGRNIKGSVVLDLFAGSGALGIEAISRGASKVYFSDCHSKPIKVITENIQSLKEEKITEIHLCDYNEMLDYLEKNKVQIDIAFVDPPYESGYYEVVAKRLLESSIIQKGSKIVFESRHEINMLLLKKYDCRHYRYGQTHILIVTK